MKHPDVRIVTRAKELRQGDRILSHVDHVFVDGEEWPVRSAEVVFRPGDLAQITLVFAGNVAIEAVEA